MDDTLRLWHHQDEENCRGRESSVMTTAVGTRGQAVDESRGFLIPPVDETKAAVVHARNLMIWTSFVAYYAAASCDE